MPTAKGTVYKRKPNPDGETWVRRCLKCEEIKKMPKGNRICPECKHAHYRDYAENFEGMEGGFIYD